ncbi:hypothetical protein WS66_25300 [Burkholderia sp. LA-2-3-30-S1-D2]|nr:hypothetical protein WS66_25300 [Burkholderia sp. LA-2-3-30-S1-D2]KVE10505.1 hypothetical protein WS66_22835 [Burkholderia sp. LA-2-3-30-S1-D2]
MRGTAALGTRRPIVIVGIDPRAHATAHANLPPSPPLPALLGIHRPDGGFALFVKIRRNRHHATRSACVFAPD